MQELKSGFKETINWNKYQPKKTAEEENIYLDFLLGVNRLFVLSFEDNGGRARLQA